MDVLHFVADEGEELLESGLVDDDRAAAVVGVETERLGFLEAAVQKENDMVVRIVDESERTDAAGFEPEVPHHPFGRGEREFARGVLTLRDQHFFEPMLDVMDSQIAVAGETDEVMLRALVIAHEDVLAMHGAVVVPPALRLLDGLALGVVVGGEGDVVLLQIAQHFLLPLGDDVVGIHVCYSSRRMLAPMALRRCSMSS